MDLRGLTLTFGLIGLGACQGPRVVSIEETPKCTPGNRGCECRDTAPVCFDGGECVDGLCAQTLPGDDDDDDDGGHDDSSSSGDSDDGDDDGCSFICLDFESKPESCDPGVQDCPEGEKCTAYVMTPGYCCVDANKCVPVIGDKQLGEVCERGVDNDDCAKGLFCMAKTSGDTGEGVCIAFCDINNPSSCAEAGLPNAKCIVYSDAVLPHCQDDCDPLAQDCTPPMGCYAVGNQGFVCTLPGHDEDKGNDNDQCYTIQSCKPGLICANGDGQQSCNSDACCTPYCDASGDGSECIEELEECVPYYEEGMAPPGFENVGLCYIPE